MAEDAGRVEGLPVPPLVVGNPIPISGGENSLEALPADGFHPPSSPIADTRANEEAAVIASGQNLEKQAKLREHNRNQFFHDWLNRGVTWVMSAVLVSLLFGVVVFAWHLLTPVAYHWLSDAQLEVIKTLLGTAIFSSALTGYVNRKMSG